MSREIIKRALALALTLTVAACDDGSADAADAIALAGENAVQGSETLSVAADEGIACADECLSSAEAVQGECRAKGNDLVACDDEAMGSLSACLIDRCDESVESFTEFTLSAALPNDGLSVCENICVNNANLERANCAANGGTTAVCTGVRDTFYGECVYNNCCGFWDRWTGKCDSVQWPY